MNGPADPLTSLAEAAVALHELYESLRAAGFTEEQALDLVKSAMRGPQP
ncbi:hypothetical protein [Streptomyces sp. NPDC050145]